MKLILHIFAAFMLFPSAAIADIIIGSWNIKHLGWDNDKHYDHVAHIANHFDLLAIQELMNEGALETLEAEVEAVSGEGWSSMASHALGQSTYREHYGFLWRDSAVTYDSGAVVYIDSRDVFAREPFSAKFSSDRTQQKFVLANVHITYGDGVGDRLPEIEALANYWEWLEEAYPETPRLLAGDFNLKPNHHGWEPLRKLGALPLIEEGATTLGMTEGVWSNLYDNVWQSPGQLEISDHGILLFPELLEVDHVMARNIVSDHAPVWLALGNAELRLAASKGGGVEAANDPVYCVDLNTASTEQLVELPNVGPVRAGEIVQMRPWGGVSELTRVNGLGAASVDMIKASGLVCQ